MAATHSSLFFCFQTADWKVLGLDPDSTNDPVQGSVRRRESSQVNIPENAFDLVRLAEMLEQHKAKTPKDLWIEDLEDLAQALKSR